jgi:hypothetical protein
MSPTKKEPPPLVYVVVLNYRGWEDTIECLESVFRSGYPNYRVVVIDNNSPNDSVAEIRKWAEGQRLAATLAPGSTPLPKPVPYAFFRGAALSPAAIRNAPEPLLIIQSEHNHGFAAGNNLFIRHVVDQDAYVWLLNPDMVAGQGALAALVLAAQLYPRATVLGSVVRNYFNPSELLEFGGSTVNVVTGTARPVRSPAEADKIDYISGGSFFTHLDNFREYGLLPEEYFLYWEETDWCHHVKESGVQFRVSESAVCYDKGGTSVGRGFLAEYYYSLNALRFLRKYNPKYIPTVLFFNLFRITKRLTQWRPARAKAIVKASFDFVTGNYASAPPKREEGRL